MSRLNIKDLAKFLSLSASTISRALSDHPDISLETKNRVREAASMFNYVPNLHARYFRKKNTRMIALILPKFDRFFIPQMLEGIQKVVDENEYKLIVFQSGNDVNSEESIIKYCLSWLVDGVLICLTDNTRSLTHLQVLKENNVPVVLLDRVIKTEIHSTVTINDYETARIAVDQFFRLGTKEIIGIFAHENLNITQGRFEGFKSILLQNHINFDEHNYLIVQKPEEAELKLKSRLNDHTYNGFFFMTDELLVNCYNAVLDLNKKIPEEISIVSISDGTSPKFLNPKVTHIFHSGLEVGSTACHLLLEHINNESKPVVHLQIETQLVDMGSIS